MMKRFHGDDDDYVERKRIKSLSYMELVCIEAHLWVSDQLLASTRSKQLAIIPHFLTTYSTVQDTVGKLKPNGQVNLPDMK